MKAKKRFFSLLLTLCLVVWLLPTSALAAETSHDISTGTLTITQDGSYTVTGTTSSNRIIVNSGVTATITLAGVSITAPDEQPAIDVQDTANLTIILQDNTANTLAGGASVANTGAPCIRVPSNATLTIQGDGTLNVTGGSSEAANAGVGIGGNSAEAAQHAEACGTVIILGGTVSITGGSTDVGTFSGVGIGGGSQSGGTGGAGGTVIILGGDVTVKGGSDAADIGAGSGHNTGASNGAGIRPSSNGTYTVYGNLTLPCDITIPQGYTLTIPNGTSLTVPTDTTLTNNGTIEIAGTLTNDGGILISSGTLNGTVSGTPAHQPANGYVYNDEYHFRPCAVEGCDEQTGDGRLHEYFNVETHTYDQQVASDTYKFSDATCTKPAKYYYSCVCGAKGTETFESGQTAEHNWNSWVSNENGTHTRTCSACGVTENENCSGGTASYFEKATCSVCGGEYGSLLTDTTAPTGEITLGTNRWNSFLNTITFGLFFNETQSVGIKADDDSYTHTGYTDDKAVKIEYLIHEDEGLSKDKLEKQTFTEYTGKFNIAPDQKCVIYVRLTDHAGNVTYLSSDGIVLDGTAATAPTVTTNGYTPGNWTDEDVTLTVSGSSALSGIAKYQVSTDNGTSWTDMTMTSGTASLTVSDSSTSADGTTYIFRAVSNSGVNGNASAPITVKIDKTAPTLTLSGNTDDYLQSDTVTVSASAEISGIAKVEVSKDGGEAQDITQSYADGYAVTENGTYTFAVTNGAGVTTTSSITYDKLDQTKPVVSLDTHGYTSDEWTNGDVTLSVSDTSAALGDTKLEYKVGDGEWQAYTGAVTASEDTNGTVYSFRAVSASGVESETVSVTVKIDKTAPDGDITIEENSVKKFIHDVTFGLFFKENVKVAITGTDSGSGVQTVEYYRSAEVLTEEQVAALTDWTAYTSAISETAQDAEQFIYYVRITDQAGNTTCFASNGATFDLTKPVITGIADGADYYTTQSVQAADTNLASVTLNGKEVGTEFTIAGNTETEYVIVAADKAGNETTVTVAMHKTEALRENLGDITKDNATSADRETVQDYLDDLKDRLEDEKLTDEEKEILEGLADEAQDILDRLDETEQAGSTEAVDQTQDITSDNVTPEDKEALEQAKEDIEQALDEFGGNYTDEEKAELEEELSRIEEALDVIERIEDTEAAIEALPDTVNPDDTKAEEQINAAKDLYDALSDYEKSLISADAKDKLEGLLAALCDYRITEGSGSTFTKGSSAGLTFTANGAYSKFTGIEVDGETVNADCYTAENGSTVITLKAEYLETLAAGKHTLTVLYTDGKATGTFTVTEKPDEVVDDDTESPQTGDDSNIALWIAVMLAAGAALTGTAVYSRKRKYSR